jgi:Uma2 family endonuclease
VKFAFRSENISREKTTARFAREYIYGYVIVAQDKMRIELYQKQSGGEWTKEILTEQKETAELKSVELSLTLADIYRGVDFDDE